MTTPYDKARAAFNAYCGMDAPQLPEDEMSQLQVIAARWANTRIKNGTRQMDALGAGEELGELAVALLGLLAATGKMQHIAMKSYQKIRGYDDEHKCRREIADALADHAIFATQLATKFRLDYGTLYKETLKAELGDDGRDWIKNPQTGR